MNMRDKLIRVAKRYCGLTGMSLSRLSTILFNDGKRLDLIANENRDVTTARYESAMQWLSDHWPADAAWLDGVDRPAAAVAAPDDGEAA